MVIHGLESCSDRVKIEDLVELTKKDRTANKTTWFEAHFEHAHGRPYTGPRALKQTIGKITDQEVELRRSVRRAKPVTQSGTVEGKLAACVDRSRN
jgi:hypothetical protein